MKTSENRGVLEKDFIVNKPWRSMSEGEGEGGVSPASAAGAC